MKVQAAINLMHCRGHFRKKKKKKMLIEEAPAKLTSYTHTQTTAP